MWTKSLTVRSKKKVEKKSNMLTGSRQKSAEPLAKKLKHIWPWPWPWPRPRLGEILFNFLAKYGADFCRLPANIFRLFFNFFFRPNDQRFGPNRLWKSLKKLVSGYFKVTFDNFFSRVGKWSEMAGDGLPGCAGGSAPHGPGSEATEVTGGSRWAEPPRETGAGAGAGAAAKKMSGACFQRSFS